jgi:hypothetical protein
MAPPNKSRSGDIDLFRLDQPLAESTNLPSSPFGSVDTPTFRRRYHSTQLAIITGVFACGGFVCSLPLVDGDKELPHHRLRQTYSSPVMTSPHRPATEPSVPQSAPLQSKSEAKTAALQHRRVCHRKSFGRRDRQIPGLRLLAALRTKWAKFTRNLRRHTMPFNFRRDLAFGSESKSSQRPLQEG